MSKINVIRKANGQLIRNSVGRIVFVKEGVNFSMNKDEMLQMNTLIKGILDDSIEQVSISKNEIIKGD